MTNEQQRILEQLERGQLALFIGADLPREITGLPSRAAIARELARRKGLAESPRLAEVAQRVGQGGNRYEFTAFIRDALDTGGSSPQPFHQRVVELVRERQIKTIITTAYDDLLKRAFQDAGAALNHVVRSGDVQFIDPHRPTLIKLYGDAQQVDTLVVTEDDHLSLWRDRDKEDVLDEVRSVLRRNVILFLGYNLSDPDFNLLWREVLDRAGRFRMGACAVWPGLSETDVQMWRDRGITILDTDPLRILDDVVVQPAPPSRPDVMVTAPTGTEGPAWNTKVMRQLVSAAFSDEELTRLCFDHFGPVYEDFGSGMGKGDKSQRLLDYCTRQRELETLIRLVEEHNPAQYARFASRLRQKVRPESTDRSYEPASLGLADVLKVYPEKQGRPYSPNGQWFSRLRIESNKTVIKCWGKVYDIQRLDSPDDQAGVTLAEFQATRLSWGEGKGLFAPISIHPGETKYLDLAWRAHVDPKICEDELRVASALDQGERNTKSPDWGKRQDFIPLKPGDYLFVVQIWAEGYNTPIEQTYQLHWPGAGQENSIHLTEIAELGGDWSGDIIVAKEP